MNDLAANTSPLSGDDAYHLLLDGFLQRGYEVRSFNSFSPDKPHLILRHDIDLSIERACKIAKTEKQMGLNSAYFVLLRSNFYNAFSGDNVARLRDIREMGHEVGIHVDFSAYEDVSDIPAIVRSEAALLEQIIEAPVTMASFHRPHATLAGMKYEEIKVPGIFHTYQPQVFSDIAYVSDSRGAWYYGHPYDHKNVKEGKAIQLLTHPIWWTAGSGLTPEAVMYEYLDHSLRDTHGRLLNEFNVIDDTAGKIPSLNFKRGDD